MHKKTLPLLLIIFSLITACAPATTAPPPSTEIITKTSPPSTESPQKKGETYHVSPDGLPSGNGSPEAPWDLATANQNLQPGDTAILHEGVYRDDDDDESYDYIVPSKSGVAGEAIVYQAAEDETPIIEGMHTAIQLQNHSYITIRGIFIRNTYFWVDGEGANHIRLENMRFEQSENYTAAYFSGGDAIYVGNSYFEGGEDSLHIMGGDFHLIENSTFEGASHECLSLGGVQHTVVRGNFFSNPQQKLLEVVGSYNGYPQRKSEYILIENNEFAFSSGTATSFAGIQFSANHSIVRRNIFHDLGYAIDLTTWDDEDGGAKFTEHNRIYNNTFYNNGALPEGAGIFFSHYDPNADFGDNLFLNNIFSENTNNMEEVDSDAQIVFNWNADPSYAGFYGNIFYRDAPENEHFAVLRLDSAFGLGAYEAQFGDFAAQNLDAAPQLLSPQKDDFHLSPSSPAIDAALPLTYTTSSGSGTQVQVMDALYFSDGKGIIPADKIRINGQAVTIIHIDYKNNLLEIAESLSWDEGTPVTLDYLGDGLDMGAIEYEK